MPPVVVRPDVYWIGVNDRTTDLFEGIWPITQEGVTYNAYLIDDDTKVIIDLAIPHNVARPVLKQFDVQYIEIEGLRTLAKENMAFREHEVKEARRVLDDFQLQSHHCLVIHPG